MRIMRQKKQILYWLLPLMGTAFALWYVKNATADVVYSDYIRLVNSYLPDVWNPAKFFVPDVLTRIPVSYLARIVNVELFGFSVTFERVLGVLSLGLSGAVFGLYCRERRVGFLWFALLSAVMFSLNKWEMLTNGSGWAHFLAFACFYYHEVVLDRVWAGEEKTHDRLKLCILPWLVILGAAGPYCASYAATLLLSYGFCMVRDHYRRADGKWDRRYVLYGLCALLPLLLYMLSNSFAVNEHAGATGRSLGQILADHPSFPVRFLLKSFAGILVGGEELQAAEVTAFTPIDFFGRRNRELKRVHTYIRKKRRKNEMELALLDAFAHYYEQGCEAEQLETAEHNYDYLQREAAEQGKLMHGSYNYHNIVFQGREVVTSNFENAKVGIQIMDLYGFLRKTMEKNGWKQDLGRRMIASYEEKRSLSEEERHLLYTLLLYPEKYWKQCNFYYNGKKSWMSSKSYEKLLRIRGQEEGRIQFLEMIKDVLF